MFAGINHVAVVVRTVGEALRFYHEVLGLPVGQQATVADQGVHAALLPVGDDEIELLEPTNPAGGVARFLEKKGEGVHHLCLETQDVAAALARVKAANLPVIDQAPRKGLAGTIAFLHPGACHGVLVEMAQPPEDAHHDQKAKPAASGIRATRINTIYVVAKDIAAAADNYAKHFDAVVTGPARNAGFGAAQAVVQIGTSRLTLLDAGEITAAAADDPFVGTRREGVLGVCLGVEDFAAAQGYLNGKGIGLSVRGVGNGSPVGRLLASNTHGVGLFMSPRN
jgi:methylmalonyl-CoA/ethylmalonyl-CoA epimerase